MFSEQLRESEQIAKFQLDKKFQAQDRRVLIIVTGGTICMQSTAKGLQVRKNYIETFLRQNPNFCDSEYTYFHGEEDYLITPESIYKKRIAYKILELEKTIDSVNMDTSRWHQISSLIYDRYDDYDAFVLLHGTDTMAYTASALAFMFENLTKPIVLTGSQLPLAFPRSDGYANMLNSLIVAGHFDIPEVLIIFENQIFRGCRARKADSESFRGFDSPNFPPLVRLGLNYDINWANILVPDKKVPTSLFTGLCDQIVVFKYSPLVSPEVLASLLAKDTVKAVIIESYGCGNLPSENQQIVSILEQANRNGTILVSISQCYRYKINIDYEAGKTFSDIGVVSGVDMTVEGVLAKLAYLLGKQQQLGLDTAWVKSQLQINLRGELTESKPELKYQVQEEDFLETLAQSMNAPELQRSDVQSLLDSLVLPNVVCFMARYGFHNFLKHMNPEKINFDSKDYDNRTPLHIAAANNNLSIVEYFVEQKVHMSPVDNQGWSPLFEALLHRHIEICKLLRKKGAELICPPDDLLDLLISYVRQKEVEMFQLVLSLGFSDFNSLQDVDYKNIGHFAVQYSATNIVHFLATTIHFDFMQKDRWNQNCLDLAQQIQLPEIEEIIKESIKANNCAPHAHVNSKMNRISSQHSIGPILKKSMPRKKSLLSIKPSNEHSDRIEKISEAFNSIQRDSHITLPSKSMSMMSRSRSRSRSRSIEKKQIMIVNQGKELCEVSFQDLTEISKKGSNEENKKK